MSVPKMPGKHLLPAAIDPSEHRAYVQHRDPDATLTTTAGAILTFQRATFTHAQALGDLQERPGWISGRLHLLSHAGRQVALVSQIGKGAPAAALVAEQLIALGIRRIISIGTAAALRTELAPGAVVVGECALRDEGTSHHYLPPGRHISAHPRLTARFAANLPGARRAATWTTDALYRESTEEAAAYAREGHAVCDMEAAGLYAVAHHRQIAATAGFCVGDSLVHRTPRTDHPVISDGLRTLLQAAVRTLTAHTDNASKEPLRDH